MKMNKVQPVYLKNSCNTLITNTIIDILVIIINKLFQKEVNKSSR